MRRSSLRRTVASALLFSICFCSRAQAEVETAPLAVVVERQLQAARPNVTTNTLISALFPGTAQAYLGHIDHALALWGAYLLIFGVSRSIIPDQWLTGGQKVSDMLIATSFLGMAGFSAVDAFVLTEARRREIDAVLKRLRAGDVIPLEELRPIQ